MKFLEILGKKEEEVFRQEVKKKAEENQYGDDEGIQKPVNKNLIKTQKIKTSIKTTEPKGPKVSSSAGQASITNFFGKK